MGLGLELTSSCGEPSFWLDGLGLVRKNVIRLPTVQATIHPSSKPAVCMGFLPACLGEEDRKMVQRAEDDGPGNRSAIVGVRGALLADCMGWPCFSLQHSWRQLSSWMASEASGCKPAGSFLAAILGH